MWVLTTIGFFSIVQKPGDELLTIRARVREDLEALKAVYLPSLGEIQEYAASDYRYRATAARDDVEGAIGLLARDIDYSNFKDTVAQRQGQGRADVYLDVWHSLYKLQST